MFDRFLWWKAHKVALRGSAPAGPRGAPELEPLLLRISSLASRAPEDAELALGEARVLISLKRNAEARKALRRARRAGAGDPDVLCQVGEGWLRLQDADKASALYTSAVQADSEHLEARIGIASLLGRHGRKKRAREHWKAALEIAPNCVLAQRTLEQLEEDAP